MRIKQKSFFLIIIIFIIVVLSASQFYRDHKVESYRIAHYKFSQYIDEYVNTYQLLAETSELFYVHELGFRKAHSLSFLKNLMMSARKLKSETLDDNLYKIRRAFLDVDNSITESLYIEDSKIFLREEVLEDVDVQIQALKAMVEDVYI